MLLIRPYDHGDREAVMALWNEVLFDPAPHNEPGAAIDRKRAVEKELFYVAELDGEIVGTVMGGYDGHRGWIYSLAVAPDRQRQGIGAALMRQIETALQERGCPKINLQVRASNTGVVAFYEKLGYQVEERVSMGKRLED